MLSVKYKPCVLEAFGRGALALAFAVCLLTCPVFADTLRAGPGDVAKTLKRAGPGDVILLAPGEYGKLRLQGRFGTAKQRVTLTSENPENPARFSALELYRAQGLLLEGLVFDYTYTRGDDPSVVKASTISQSKHITIRRSVFDGDNTRDTGTPADGYGAAFGMFIRDSQKIEIEASTFRGFYRGLLVGQVQGITLRGSDFYNMRSDGVNFAEVTDVLIENNVFRDFRRHADDLAHPDMIQFWTNGTNSPNRNITIRDNILNGRNGDWSQSIFMRNERVDVQGAGPEMYYRNVTITGNVIINAHLHGITLGESNGVLIADNTLIRNHAAKLTGPNKVVFIPVINVAPVSRNVAILRNITAGIAGPQKQSDWRVSDNLKIQDEDPGAPGYYDSVFIGARYGDPETLAPFMYLPTGPAGSGAVGAPALRLSGDKDRASRAGQAPSVQVTRDARFVNRFTFDATQNPAVSDGGITWDFGDGTQAKGAVARHTFPGPGHYVVSARSQTKATAPKSRIQIKIPAPQVLRFQDGKVLVQQDDGEAVLEDIPLKAPNALPMGQGRDPLKIHPKHLAGFWGANDMVLDFRLRAARTNNPSGEILRIHNNLVISMTGQGQIQVSLNTAETAKPVVATTAPLKLHNGAWHDVMVRYEADTGLLLIVVNDTERARARAKGKLRAMESWGVIFGNPWDKKTFDGLIADLTLRANVTSFAVP